MKFVVTINVGNDAMQTSGEVAESLERIARDLRETGEAEAFTEGDVGTGVNVRDRNGNTVGEWVVVA